MLAHNTRMGQSHQARLYFPANTSDAMSAAASSCIAGMACE
jgi:hypothetical protein